MSGGRRFSQELLQKIKAANNIVEIVGEHVVLRKSGANYTGLCPFHSERSPSFSVSENKQLYHCYGCKKGGDLLSFIMEIHGLEFAEAIEELAARARVPLPKDWGGGAVSGDPEARRIHEEQRKKLQTAYDLNRFAALYFKNTLPTVAVAEQYFRKRGVGEELKRNFYLGAAMPGWEGLAAYLVAKQAPLPLSIELGLIRPSTKQAVPGGSGYFDLFRNRAIFPIIDMRGRVAGFGGRSLPGPDGEAESPKYLNSPESLVFHKSKLAFGLFQAQKHIREKDEVILVEGYFDVLALHAAGFQNVVASCGTSLTPEHLALFKRFASRVTVLFDSDKAGISATERAMELGLEHGQVLLGANLPENLDPDEVLFDQQTGAPLPGGREKMESILQSARPLIDSRMEECIVQAQSGPEARTQALKKMGAWLARYTDPVGREVRLQHLQNRLEVSMDLLQRAMGASPGSPPVQQRGPAPQAPAPRPFRPQVRPNPPGNARSGAARLNPAEKVLLAGLLRSGAYATELDEAGRNLPPNVTISDLFDYAPAQNFVSSLLREPGALERFRIQPQTFLAEIADPQVRSTLTEALVAGEAGLREGEYRGALLRGIGRAWARFSQRIKRALAEAEAKKDAGLHSQLMKEYLDVQRKMKEFSRFYDEA